MHVHDIIRRKWKYIEYVLYINILIIIYHDHDIIIIHFADYEYIYVHKCR